MQTVYTLFKRTVRIIVTVTAAASVMAASPTVAKPLHHPHGQLYEGRHTAKTGAPAPGHQFYLAKYEKIAGHSQKNNNQGKKKDRKNRYSEWQNLSPEEKNRLRQRMKKYQKHKQGGL